MGAEYGVSIVVLGAAYIGVLVSAARLGRNRTVSRHIRVAVYGLTTGMCFSVWAYYGAESIVAGEGWQCLKDFLAPLLVVTLFFPLWRKIAVATKRENVGSLAEFLASRYGKNAYLGPVVTSVALVGTMPYTAMQLKSMSMFLIRITPENFSHVVIGVSAICFFALIIFYGARQPTLTEHNYGLMRVTALQALIKLLTLLILVVPAIRAICSTKSLHALSAHLIAMSRPPTIDGPFVSVMLMIFASTFCMPRQFYVGFTELEKVDDLKPAMGYVISYFLLTSAATVIVLMGSSVLAPMHARTQLYLVDFELRDHSLFLTDIGFLGGFFGSAALFALQIVSLALMTANELVLPLLARVRWKLDSHTSFDMSIVVIRRCSIGVVLAGAWLCFVYMDKTASLTDLGNLSFAAVAQMFPALVGGIIWRRGHASGALWGICGGFAVWLLLLALPLLAPNAAAAIYGTDLPGLTGQLMPIALLSLTINTTLYITKSLSATPTLIDAAQGTAFISPELPSTIPNHVLHGTVADLKKLVAQFVGKQDVDHSFAQIYEHEGKKIREGDPVDHFALRTGNRILSGAIGTVLAHTVLGWKFPQVIEPENLENVLGSAAHALQFNRELLHSTLDNLDSGVSVVDADLRLVAWNRRYVDLLELPKEFLYVGRPIADVILYSLSKLGTDAREIEHSVGRRLEHIRRRNTYVSERVRPNGTVLRIVASPMSAGRYVTSFSDVTELHRTANALAIANEKLEERVARRTEELTTAVSALATAKAIAEHATEMQTRFLAAASHDVLQPLQAARLFIATMTEELAQDSEARELLSNADHSIESAHGLLRSLLNLSRVEVGGGIPDIRPVSVDDLLKGLIRDFEHPAADKGLSLKVFFGGQPRWVLSNPDLLRSILQNLVGNAVRYTTRGSVVICTRFDSGGLRFEVRDSGPGIERTELNSIFEEFVRLPGSGMDQAGTGLGLSIAKRVCEILGHKLGVRSKPGRGSVFSVTVTRANFESSAGDHPLPSAVPRGLSLLYVDDDHDTACAMTTLLMRWGVSVTTARSIEAAKHVRGRWDIILADYQLDDEITGLDLIETMRNRAAVLALLVTSPDAYVIERAAVLGVEVILKPVAPIFLRMFLNRAGFAATYNDAPAE